MIMLDGLKTQITLAVLAVKTMFIDFAGVSADQINETVSTLITISLIIVASYFKHLGNFREEQLKKTIEWAEKKKEKV